MNGRRARTWSVFFAAGALASGAACVDLFHSTDFATLCSADAAACAAETGTTNVSDATVDGPAAPIDLCKDTRAARKASEHACAFLGACLGTAEGTSYGACMVRALAAYDCSFNPSLRPRGAIAALWQCLSNATTCEETALCVFGTAPPPCPGDNTGGGTFTGCNLPGESVVVECAASTTPLGMEPCALRGRTCARVDSKGFCAGAGGASCTGRRRCEGTAAVECKSAGGIDSDEGLDCAGYGDGTCAEDDAGVACEPVATAASCAGSSAIVCNDAGTAESCVGGKTVQIDCDAVGQRCVAEGVSTVDPVTVCSGLPDGGACSFAQDHCATDGETLRSCVRGTLYEVRCADVAGLKDCAQTAGRPANCRR